MRAGVGTKVPRRLAIGQICFFIPVALIAKPIPGKEPHYSK